MCSVIRACCVGSSSTELDSVALDGVEEDVDRLSSSTLALKKVSELDLPPSPELVPADIRTVADRKAADIRTVADRKTADLPPSSGLLPGDNRVVCDREAAGGVPADPGPTPADPAGEPDPHQMTEKGSREAEGGLGEKEADRLGIALATFPDDILAIGEDMEDLIFGEALRLADEFAALAKQADESLEAPMSLPAENQLMSMEPVVAPSEQCPAVPGSVSTPLPAAARDPRTDRPTGTAQSSVPPDREDSPPPSVFMELYQRAREERRLLEQQQRLSTPGPTGETSAGDPDPFRQRGAQLVRKDTYICRPVNTGTFKVSKNKFSTYKVDRRGTYKVPRGEGGARSLPADGELGLDGAPVGVYSDTLGDGVPATNGGTEPDQRRLTNTTFELPSPGGDRLPLTSSPALDVQNNPLNRTFDTEPAGRTLESELSPGLPALNETFNSRRQSGVSLAGSARGRTPGSAARRLSSSRPHNATFDREPPDGGDTALTQSPMNQTFGGCKIPSVAERSAVARPSLNTTFVERELPSTPRLPAGRTPLNTTFDGEEPPLQDTQRQVPGGEREMLEEDGSSGTPAHQQPADGAVSAGPGSGPLTSTPCRSAGCDGVVCVTPIRAERDDSPGGLESSSAPTPPSQLQVPQKPAGVRAASPASTGGLRQPAAGSGLRLPSAVSGLRPPGAVSGLRPLGAVGGLRQPAAGAAGLRHSSSTSGLPQPAAAAGLRHTASASGLRQPAASGGLRQPGAGSGLRQPAAGSGLRQPRAGFVQPRQPAPRAGELRQAAMNSGSDSSVSSVRSVPNQSRSNPSLVSDRDSEEPVSRLPAPRVSHLPGRGSAAVSRIPGRGGMRRSAGGTGSLTNIALHSGNTTRASAPRQAGSAPARGRPQGQSKLSLAARGRAGGDCNF